MQEKHTKSCAWGKIFLVRSAAVSTRYFLKLGWPQRAFVCLGITVWFAAIRNTLWSPNP